MFIEEVAKDDGRPSYVVYESFRDGGELQKRVIGDVSFLTAEQVEGLRAVLRGARPGDRDAAPNFDLLATIPHGHVAAVLGTAERLGLPEMIGSRPCWQRRLVMALIVSRILDPEARLEATLHLTTLASELELDDDVSEAHIRYTLRWLAVRKERIEKALAAQDDTEPLIVFALFGAAEVATRDGVVPSDLELDRRRERSCMGILASGNGRPLGLHRFDGAGDSAVSAAEALRSLPRHFRERRPLVVSGSEREFAGLAAVAAEGGASCVHALDSAGIKKLVAADVIHPELFEEDGFLEAVSGDFPGARLLAYRDPVLAEERHHVRDNLLTATEFALNAIADETTRKGSSLRGKDRIRRRVQRTGERFRMLKHFDLNITDRKLRFRRNEQSITHDADLDGLAVLVVYNVSANDLSSAELVRLSREQQRFEVMFRRFQPSTLLVDPVLHYDQDMIAAHQFLCVLAAHVQWEMERSVHPMFDRENERNQMMDPEKPFALKGKTDGRDPMDDVLPVRSFTSLLGKLANFTQVVYQSWHGEMDMAVKYARASRLQERAFELLGLSVPEVAAAESQVSLKQRLARAQYHGLDTMVSRSVLGETQGKSESQELTGIRRIWRLKNKTLQRLGLRRGTEAEWGRVERSAWHAAKIFGAAAVLSVISYFAWTKLNPELGRSIASQRRLQPASVVTPKYRVNDFMERSDAMTISESVKQAVTSFMNGETLEERCQFLDGGLSNLAIMEEYYSRDGVSAPQKFGKVTHEAPYTQAGYVFIGVTAEDSLGDTHTFTLIPGQDRMLIEWKASVQYSEMSWTDFWEKKPADPVEMRVQIFRPPAMLTTSDRDFVGMSVKGVDTPKRTFISPGDEAFYRINDALDLAPDRAHPMTVMVRWNERQYSAEITGLKHLWWVDFERLAMSVEGFSSPSRKP